LAREEIAFRQDILGNGLVAPLRRTGSDFASASGEKLVASAIAQILGTRPGELPWRPDFGADLEPFRHRNASEQLVQEISDEVVQAIARWEPRVTIASCEASVLGAIIYVKVTWVVVTQAAANNNLIIGPVSQEVQV
jgi:phage baseplate assembly protein W